ncbi:MAG TPA: hypothetical protein QGF58_02140 [Myxococcota bacterium]|nr:hypothetical protein [Myxococcota bacterium]
MSLFTRTCPFCKARFDPPAWHAPYCSWGCKKVVMEEERDDQRRAKDNERREWLSAPAPAPTQSVSVDQGLMHDSRRILKNARDCLAEGRQQLARMRAENRDKQARLDRFDRQGASKVRLGELGAELKSAKAEYAGVSSALVEHRDSAEAASREGRARTKEADRKLEELLGEIDGVAVWMMGFVGDDVPRGFTVQLDDTSAEDKSLRSLGSYVARKLDEQDDELAETCASWRGTGARRVPRVMNRQIADEVASMARKFYGLSARTVRPSPDRGDYPVEDELEIASLDGLMRRTEAKVLGLRAARQQAAEEAPEQDLMALLDEACAQQYVAAEPEVTPSAFTVSLDASRVPPRRRGGVEFVLSTRTGLDASFVETGGALPLSLSEVDARALAEALAGTHAELVVKVVGA